MGVGAVITVGWPGHQKIRKEVAVPRKTKQQHNFSTRSDIPHVKYSLVSGPRLSSLHSVTT